MALIKPRHTRPRIAIISYKGLSRLAHSLLPKYADRADIKIIDTVFDKAVEIAREIDSLGAADIFISAGANGAFLRDTVSLPTVLIRVSGFDLMQAIEKARKISDRIAIVTYKQKNSELDGVTKLLDIDIEQRSYITIDDVKEQFHDLANKGYKVIIGSSMVVELAEKEGLTGILVYSSNSVQHALEQAFEIHNITQIVESRTERLNTILNHINEGVVSVDINECIQSLNPTMENLLATAARDAIGKKLSDISPQLSLVETLKHGKSSLEEILHTGHRTIILNRIPIKYNGLVSGAVLTFQDSNTIERADRHFRSQNRTRKLAAKYKLSNIICTSKSIQDIKDLSAQYAKTDSTILITGESGTGKELFAQGIHNASKRRNRPFVAINCAAIAESILESELFGHEEGSFTGSRRGGKTGLFEVSHTGTIFLDEIGDMPISLQTRLLRVLQEKEVLRLGANIPIPVDVRIIAATNKDLKACIQNGQFREDLYYRLNILHMHIPPIREHKEDIPKIFEYQLHDALHKIGCHKDVNILLNLVLKYILSYSWPGNVREMENIAERLAVFYSDMSLTESNHMEHLHNIIPEILNEESIENTAPITNFNLNQHEHIDEISRVRQAISECGGNLSQASKLLGISRTTLWRKLNKAKQQTA